MAKLTNRDLAPFWGPQPGDYVVGTYIKSKEGEYGRIHEIKVHRGNFYSEHRGKVISTSKIPIVTDADSDNGYLEGEYLAIGGNKILDDAFDMIDRRDIIEIWYLGKVPTRDGRREYHSYEAYQLESLGDNLGAKGNPKSARTGKGRTDEPPF